MSRDFVYEEKLLIRYTRTQIIAMQDAVLARLQELERSEPNRDNLSLIAELKGVMKVTSQAVSTKGIGGLR
jgi:hypothetical protein